MINRVSAHGPAWSPAHAGLFTPPRRLAPRLLRSRRLRTRSHNQQSHRDDTTRPLGPHSSSVADRRLDAAGDSMNLSVYQRSIFLGQTTRQLLFILGLLACVTVCTPLAYAQMLPPSAPPLPAPTGQVISVSTVSELQAAVNGLASGQTILIQPGTYRLTQELRFRFGVTNVALRGATNNRDDVVILGSGMGTKGVN